jgi:hypothetical protein
VLLAAIFVQWRWEADPVDSWASSLVEGGVSGGHGRTRLGTSMIFMVRRSCRSELTSYFRWALPTPTTWMIAFVGVPGNKRGPRSAPSARQVHQGTALHSQSGEVDLSPRHAQPARSLSSSCKICRVSATSANWLTEATDLAVVGRLRSLGAPFGALSQEQHGHPHRATPACAPATSRQPLTHDSARPPGDPANRERVSGARCIGKH